MRTAIFMALGLAACGDPTGESTPCLDVGPIDAGPGDGNGIERLGAATVCFAAEDDIDDFPLSRAEARVGLTVVAEEDRSPPPERFRTCIVGVAETAELLDANGVRLWLGIDAHYGAQELVPRGLLQNIAGADLRLGAQEIGFTPSTSLAITRGAQLIVAMEVFGRITGPFGPLDVENAGGSSQAVQGDCGPETPLALRFQEQAVANGDDVQLVLEGSELVATNIHSVDHTEQRCTDSIRGVDATWIAVDRSL